MNRLLLHFHLCSYKETHTLSFVVQKPEIYRSLPLQKLLSQLYFHGLDLWRLDFLPTGKPRVPFFPADGHFGSLLNSLRKEPAGLHMETSSPTA